jgi:hypothetical protein
MRNNLLLRLALTGALCCGAAFGAATITIVNVDGPNEGFNDPTPRAPVGGNSGTTLGQQRLIAFQYAASLWGAKLDSTVDIRIQASFDPLTCTATSAVLGFRERGTTWRWGTSWPAGILWIQATICGRGSTQILVFPAA